MPITTHTLICLFPIAFMLHDFEEIILSAPWQRKYAREIKERLQGKVPSFLAKQIGLVLDKPTGELTTSISLIFALACLSAFLAVEYQAYGLLIFASGMFFLHGFMHLGQAILLRKYIPAVISSALIVIPYGLILYNRIIQEGKIDLPEMLIYSLLAVILTIPFILVMHKAGGILYKAAVRLLIG